MTIRRRQSEGADQLPDGQPDSAPISNGKPPESKADRFRRLANRRVPNALKALGYVENLANAASYQYTDEQRDKIVTALDATVKRIKERFSGTKPAQQTFEV